MTAPAAPQPLSQSARQVSATSHAFVGLTLGLTALAACASFALSFHAQAAVGELIGLSGGLEFVLPVATDLWIVCALLTLAVLRARGQGGAVSGSGWARLRFSGQAVQRVSLVGWTLASIGLNIGHALTTYRGSDALGLMAVAGVAALFPLGVLVGSEGVLSLVLRPSEAPAVARAKTTLVNAGTPVAVKASQSASEQDVDAVIAAALSKPAASIRGVAGEVGVSVYRVRSVKTRLAPTPA